MIGQTFGRLTVVGKGGVTNQQMWVCECICGNRVSVRQVPLKTGHTRSCGCLRREVTRLRRTEHGKTNTPEYGSWQKMKERCLNPNCPAYKNYGGRGIKICEQWINSFTAFLSDLGPRPVGYTLERINNSGNYEPGNCKWATRAEQNNNTRKTRYVEHNGETLTLKEWAKRTGINSATLRNRIFNFGYTPERAFSQPVMKTYDHKKLHHAPV